jgi:hypothetical protein
MMGDGAIRDYWRGCQHVMELDGMGWDRVDGAGPAGQGDGGVGSG